MSTARTSAIIATAIGLGITALAHTAMAQANCAIYAKVALQQQKANIENKCAYKGPEWNDQHQRHMHWCSTVGPEQWKEQLKMRAEKLAKCKKK